MASQIETFRIDKFITQQGEKKNCVGATAFTAPKISAIQLECSNTVIGRVCVCVCVCPASLVLDMSISLSDSNVALCLKLNSHSVDVIEIIIVVVIVMLLQNVKGTRTRPSLSSTPARRTKEERSSSATSGPSLKARSWLTKTTSSCTMITMVKTLIIIRINC